MKKQDKKQQKRKIDKTQLFGRIMAGVLAGLMVIASCSTLIYCIIRNAN